ncbi:MAG TPA: 3-dehydroquinate synthase [Abditibacteriaceae bacterium]|nr:3-dehydroquinate synthase [Abditibacteriaceae bacterium]
MKITVPLRERAYDIVVENGLLSTFDTTFLPHEIAVLSNETVAPHYAAPLIERLRANEHRVLDFNAPEGEGAKNLDWVSRAYDVLAEAGFGRSGAVVAVGGGVVGDWAGFVAATWMRGVRVIQVPTTLLAMVDSSVGGKTGVNHTHAKNLIGAFHQPDRVLIDPDCLQTLPMRELRAGLAEVVKYGIINDPDFFGWLERNIDAALKLEPQVIEHIIARSCEVKAQVVGEDERESDSSGVRATLNYGHTVGHAVEATSGYGEFLHGEAIAIGMTVAAQLAKQLGVCEQADDLIARQTRLFRRIGLPTETKNLAPFKRLWAAMTLDKKSRDGRVNFILPQRLGEVQLVRDVAQSDVRAALKLCAE